MVFEIDLDMELTCNIHLSNRKELEKEDSYFELLYKNEPIISIGTNVSKQQKKKTTHDSGFDANSIYWGTLGMIYALAHKHKITKNIPWPDLINKSVVYPESRPLFIPICTIGCCGYEDFGIEIINESVNLTNDDGHAYTAKLDDYIEIILKCIDEIIRWNREGNNGQYGEKIWHAVWLCTKVGLESPGNIKNKFIPKFYELCQKYNIFIG